MLFRKIAPLMLVASCGSAYADPGQTEWIATPNRAYAAMPATSLTDGKVSNVSWSTDGEHLLVADRSITTSREQLLRFDGSAPTYGSLELLGWDRRFHQIRHLWGTEDATATIDHVAWLKGTSVALVTVRWVVRDGAQSVQHPLYGVLDLDAGTGKYRWVPGMEQLVARPLIKASPTLPIAAAVFSDNPESDGEGDATFFTAIGSVVAKGQTTVNLVLSGGGVLNGGGEGQTFDLSNALIAITAPPPLANNFWTLDAGGRVLHAIKVVKAIQLPLVWNLDGSAWFLVDTDAKTQKPLLAHLTDQGSLEPTAEQEYAAKQPESELTIGNVSATAKQGKSQVNYTNIWLRSQTAVDDGEMLLTADGEWPELSPSNGGVFYIDGGVAKVRELIPLTAEQRRAAREAPKPVAMARLFEKVYHISLVTAGSNTPPQP